ncbi:tRNA 2-thiouridine(34) synthase MnmA [Peptacetobacter hominis]|uniref:tRNA-specific 2-thiouridylase MnmA n=1 Tax=Peptacetobacter hominis TaxID=2743610 RepID=A0A544QV80_9FIRM|nr:tRNA 2-thiouridine(34) synthase MnmA [Peptacetobacter hominis]TQQ84608.1 tRNA 2-thiouridine(34) synthase MnmA [Peptacetobacter hominis]
MTLNNRVMIGMSGGVDSSVAAYLLKKKGYDVVGVTMRLSSDETPEEKEITENSIRDARNVAEKLGIPFHVIDLQKEFKERVINNFISEYMKGRTPNPCVVCNKYIKFGMFFDKAKEFGCDYVATGHYAKIEKDENTGRYLLRKGDSDKKDQTYNLYNIKQEQLSRILLPIGEYEKEDVRAIAKEIGLDVHNKKDSQEICFIKDDDYIGYLTRHSRKKIKQGDFKDAEGKVIGHHKGIINYTIGQRKGLGVTFGKPMFVIDINAKDNSIILGDNSDLFRSELIADDVNFIPFDFADMKEPIRVMAKIRYAAKPSEATVYKIDDNSIRVVFDEPQRAITKGQSLVMYDGRTLVGGGIIQEIL